MGGGKGGGAPAPPDYGSLANQMSTNDLAMARFQQTANNPFIFSPDYNVTYAPRSPGNPMDPGLNMYIQPQGQAALAHGSEMANKYQANMLGGGLLQQASGQLGYHYALPSIPRDVQTENLQRNLNPYNYNTNVGQVSGWDPGAPNYQLLSESYNQPEIGNPHQARVDAVEAIYSQYKSRLDPEWNQRAQALEQSLYNKGFQPGSDHYEKAMENFERARTDAYQTAYRTAVDRGGEEASRQFGMGLQRRQQGEAEVAQRAAMWNQFAAADLANKKAQYDSQMGIRQQRFGEEAASASFYNQAALQTVNERLQQAEYIRALNDMLFNQDAARRAASINEFQSIVGGQQINYNAPQFQGIGGLRSPDLVGAAQSGYQGQLAQYNAKQQANQNMWQGIMGGAGMAASFIPFLL